MPADLRRKIALAAALAAAFVAGCGGDDPTAEEARPKPTPSAKTTAERTAEPAPSEPTSADDREQIAAVLGKMESAINDGDADRLCTDVYAFRDRTKSDCVKVFGPLLTQSEARAEITLKSVERKGSRATVNVVNRGLGGSGSSSQSFRFIKRDDEWRVLFD